MAHTPGPWEVVEIAHSRVYRVEINAPQFLYGRRTHSRYIANIVDYAEWTDQPDNARLIAAAPDLLAAAKEVERWWIEQEMQQHLKGAPAGLFMLRAAIAKAEGGAI